MKVAKRCIGVVVLVTTAFSVGSFAQQKAAEQLKITTGSDLQWTKGPRPDVMISPMVGKASEPGFYMHRLKFAAGTTVGPHTHPVDEHITVLSGTFNIGQGEKLEESKAEAVKAGGLVVIPAGVPHFVITKEETITQLSGVGPNKTVYLDPKDDPAKKQ